MLISRLIAVAACLVVAGIGAKPAIRGPMSTYDVVKQGMTCKQSTVDPTQRDCEYRVGNSLRFGIAGVGMLDAGIVFEKSDIDGDYYAAYGVAHGCVVVWPGGATMKTAPGRAFDAAFVSPATGEVYTNWATCGAATK